ncbi:competence lipoprotein ComL, putative [invertebrate metagenome]|uniref:Competence lipoprotein ComL, putative n=1 Tax=invertebrate metagenome TaxID=1711999 RepID=A0A484H8F2_9ZZZZ
MRIIILTVLIGEFTACTTLDTNKVERPVGQLYNEAMNFLEGGAFQAAAKVFAEVERQHPYSVWATKAQLMAAYAYYEGNRYDEAVIALHRFIQLHPSHRDAAYAYYVKALCYYEQIIDVDRDQKMTVSAVNALQDVISRFPLSLYARASRLKLDLAIDNLAGKEMTIGRFYIQKQHYAAAINRFNTVIANYQTTAHIPEALHRLVESYTALGLLHEARQVAAVLGANFPGSLWYHDSYSLILKFS